MFSAGTSFWVRADRHLWVVISDPLQDASQVVHVNFTSLDESAPLHDPYNDRACLVTPGEHPFIDDPTCVYYCGVQIASVAHLESRYNRRDLTFGDPVSEELLAKMRHGATVSEHILPIAHDILVDQGLV